MIFFPILRTKRLTVQFKELTIGQSIALAKMPPQQLEAETTAFLKMAIDKVIQGDPDPLNWTVQERIFAVCHYIASTQEGNPDFEVGEGHFTDYFDGSIDKDSETLEKQIFLIDSGDDKWYLKPLTGRMVESIERLQGEVKFVDDRPIPPKLHWLLGSMAAQMVLPGTDIEEPVTEAEMDEAILKRMIVFLNYPESEFLKLIYSFLEKRREFGQFFDIATSEDGIICLAKKKEAGQDTDLPPAQFPPSSVIGEFAKAMGG